MSDEARTVQTGDVREHFTKVVRQVVEFGEVVYITDDDRSKPYAAIVPVDLLEHYERLRDEMEERLLDERMALLEAGKTKTLSADEVKKELGLV